MINVGGKKVSPVEVENAIISLGIEDCVCVGIDDPRGVLGQVVKAYLLKGTSNLTFEDIMISLMAKLEHFKVPVEYEWVDKIPKTLSGKKQRLLLCKSNYGIIINKSFKSSRNVGLYTDTNRGKQGFVYFQGYCRSGENNYFDWY